MKIIFDFSIFKYKYICQAQPPDTQTNKHMNKNAYENGCVAELVDATDLKSVVLSGVPVRLRP